MEGYVLSVSVKYKGLKDGPVVVTPEGRFPSVATGVPAAGKPDDPLTYYQSADASQMKLALRKRSQELALQEARRKIDALARALEGLHVPADDVVVRARTAVSDQPGAVSASADEEATLDARHTVTVYHPAAGGEVLSQTRNPVAEVELDDGTYSLTVTVEGTEHTVSVEVNNSGETVDTEEELMRRVARAIDGVDWRIKAEVVNGEEDAYDPLPRSRPMNRTVRIRVSSALEGHGADFSIADAEGELASHYGLDQGTPPRDAFMVLGGAVRRQESNQLSLDLGHVSGEVKDATDGPANITVYGGEQVIGRELAAVISQYNDLVRFLDAHADLIRPSLKDRIVRPLEARFQDFAAADLYPTASGRLQLGEDFGDTVTWRFAQVRGVLFGEEGWVPALKEKLSQIRALDIQDFALDLENRSPATARQQAWSLVANLSANIVDGYY